MKSRYTTLTVSWVDPYRNVVLVVRDSKGLLPVKELAETRPRVGDHPVIPTVSM